MADRYIRGFQISENIKIRCLQLILKLFNISWIQMITI